MSPGRVPQERARRRPWRMGPLCTWLGPGFGVQIWRCGMKAGDKKREQRQRREAKGSKTPQRAEI